MNKREFVNAYIEKMGKEVKRQAEREVECFFEIIKEALAKEEEVAIVNFGTFKYKTRAARKITIGVANNKVKEIPRRKVVVFQPSKVLKEMTKVID